MIGHHHRHTVVAVLAPAQLANGLRRLQQRLHCKAPHGQDDFGLEQLDLAPQKRLALRHLFGLRVAVAGGAALQHVGNKNIVVPVQLQGAQHVVQQFAGLTDEGLALDVLVLAGRLAHDHPVGLFVAHAKHGIAPVVAQLAGLAAGNGVTQRGPVHAGHTCGALAQRHRSGCLRTHGGRHRH